MAGRSFCSGYLFCLSVIVLFSAQFFKYPMKLLGKDDELQMLMAAGDVSHPKIPESRLKMRSSSSPTKTTIDVKAVVVIRLLNMTLAANLILLWNDISLNPGPSTNSPATMKGLCVFHLNICSLRNKQDELRLFCNKYKPHVLSLKETWLNGIIAYGEISLPGYNLMRRAVGA